MSEHADGVDVSFESGAERRFHLVFGADGQRSNVRNLTFGEDASFENFLGYYVAVVTIETGEPPLHTALNYSEPGRGVYLYRPVDKNEALAFFLFAQTQKLDCGPHETARHKQILAKGMVGMGWKVSEMVAKAMDADDLYFDAVSQIKMTSWSKGRAALLGDAAFAASSSPGRARNWP